ncbi:MAG TPA: phosphoglycerate dehydrogenase, partial [Patescibacteria group bacterium]
VGISSRTYITKKVADNAPKLLAVGRFGIGVNNIDLQACNQNGIAVFNAPYSSTRSVVELALGEMMVLFRRVVEKNEKAQKGIWDKTDKNCHEIRGKKLGIIGYGNIGFQIGLLAEALGMEVYYYDVFEKLALGKAKAAASLAELLKTADVLTLHLDGRKENTNFIGEKEFKLMKDGVIIINTSRGHIIDIEALAKYVKNGKVLGAALDVFPKEPKSNSEPFSSILQGLPNVILTPHIAGRSEEAQEHMGGFVPEKIINFINTGSTVLSVNFPNILLPAQEKVHRIIHIHKNTPGVLAEINNVFAKHKINVEGQYLKTNESIGYVISDVNKATDEKLVKELKAIPQTIRVRILY